MSAGSSDWSSTCGSLPVLSLKEQSATAALCDYLTHKVLINYEQRNYRRFPM